MCVCQRCEWVILPRPRKEFFQLNAQRESRRWATCCGEIPNHFPCQLRWQQLRSDFPSSPSITSSLACHFPGHSDSEPLEGPPEKLRNFLNKFKQIKEQWQLCCFVGFPATFSTKPQSFFEYFPYQVLLFFSGLVSPRQTPKTDFALQPKAAESWSPRFVFLANVCCRSRHAPFSAIHPTSPPTRSALPGRTCSTAPFPAARSFVGQKLTYTAATSVSAKYSCCACSDSCAFGKALKMTKITAVF